MNGRDFHFDHLFSPKFYEYNDANTELKVAFPLPTSPETMQDFLQSKDGGLFRAGLIALVERLQNWVRAHGLPALADPCEDFKRIYSTFTGKDPDFNKIYFALFRQGLPHLAAICDLLDSDKIPLNIKQDNIKNLISGIKVCPPGASTNIADTYWKLAAQLNLATELMATRRQIVQQIVLESLKEVKGKLGIADDALIGMEIHYVNTIINEFAKVFAVKVTDDEYANICDPLIKIALLLEFLKAVPGKLTVEAVISKIAFERDVEDLLKSDLAYDKVQSFEQGLMHYGEDPNFSFYDFIILEGDGETHKPTWHVDYNMFLTLFNRFAQNGYLLVEDNLQKHKLANHDVVRYLPENSLNLAFVVTEGKQKPFIPYFMDVLSGDNQEKTIELMNFLLLQLTDDQRFGIVQGIHKYMKYYAEQMLQESALKKWVNVIIDILPDAYQFDLILKDLPKAGQELYLTQLGRVKLKKLIQNGNQLINVLSTLSPDQAHAFLNQLIGKDSYPLLVATGKQLAVILNILPVEDWDTCIRSLGDKRLEIMNAKNVDKDVLATLFSRLPANQWNAFFTRYFSNNWWECITTMEQLTAILKVLPQEKWESLFQHLEPERILKMIGHDRLLLVFTFFHWQRLLALLQALSTEQCKIFLTHMGSNMIRTLVGGRIDSPLPDFLEGLPDDKSKVLLDCFGKNNLIDDMFTATISSFNLHDVLYRIPEEKCVFLLNYLGQRSLHQIMEEKPRFWTELLTKLQVKKCNLFFDQFGQEKLHEIFPRLKRILLVMGTMHVDKAELFLKRFTPARLEVMRDDLVSSFINLAFTRKFDSLSPGRMEKALAEIKQSDNEIHAALIPAGIPIDTENMVFRTLNLHRDHITGWILLRFLVETPKIFNEPAFRKRDPEKLLTLFANHLGPALKTLPEDKCSVIFGLFGDKQKPLLIEKLHQLVQQTKSLIGLAKIPKSIGVELLSNYNIDQVAAFVQDRDQLIAALKFLPAARNVNLLDVIGSKRLFSILLDKQSVKDEIQIIERYKSDPSLFDSLLLALLRARKEQFLLIRNEPAPIALPFFKAAQESPAAYELLEASLAKNINEGNHAGLLFFNTATHGQDHRELKEAVHMGELNKITNAFRAHQG